MKKAIFLILITLIWPMITGAQFLDEFEEVWQVQEEFDNWSNKTVEKSFPRDTMSLKDALVFRTRVLGKKEFSDFPDFVITKTKIDERFNEGIYWPDGTVVPLPRKFLPDLLTLEERSNRLFLSFVTRDENGGYSILFLPLPDLEVKQKIPGQVFIEPILCP